MPRARKSPTEQARIASFANEELQQLVDALYTQLNFKVSAPDMLGALVLAARRLPLEVVESLLPTYVAREREERAKARQ
jgi:hypothetical protein